MALLIPLLAIFMGIGIGMLAIYLEYRKRKEMFELYHKERMAAIEKGMELPPLPEEFFSNGKPSSPHAKLLAGLILLFLGLALFVALYFTAGFSVALYALVPGSIGLALLLYYFVIGRKEAAELEADRARRKASLEARTPSVTA